MQMAAMITTTTQNNGSDGIMDKSDVIEILENEIACVKAGSMCDRQCEKCQLVRDERDIISALRYAIAVIVEAKEAAPIRRATWIPDSDPDSQPNEYGEIKYFCSYCDCCDVHLPNVAVPYCWNCGSKMS